MRTLVITVISLLAILNFQSCKNCKGNDTSYGAISGDITIACPLHGKQVVIRTLAEADSILDSSLCNYNDINYNVFSVIGCEMVGTCENRIERGVIIDDAAKKYIYKIDLYSCKCWRKNAQVFNNLVLVPKIPDDYTVEFVTHEE